jgi:hypothetical protein
VSLSTIAMLCSSPKNRPTASTTAGPISSSASISSIAAWSPLTRPPAPPRALRPGPIGARQRLGGLLADMADAEREDQPVKRNCARLASIASNSFLRRGLAIAFAVLQLAAARWHRRAPSA